MISSYWPKRTQ